MDGHSVLYFNARSCHRRLMGNVLICNRQLKDIFPHVTWHSSLNYYILFKNFILKLSKCNKISYIITQTHIFMENNIVIFFLLSQKHQLFIENKLDADAEMQLKCSVFNTVELNVMKCNTYIHPTCQSKNKAAPRGTVFFKSKLHFKLFDSSTRSSL